MTFFKKMAGIDWKLSFGWRLRFDLNGFMYIINLKNLKIKLELSDQLRFPSASGWFKFKKDKAWFYILLVGKSLKLEW